MVETDAIDIEAVGAQGDGIGGAEGQRVFVPFALPGERWRRVASGFERIGAAGPQRAAPVCPHFESCGGCVAQHMAAALYVDWKRQLLIEPLWRAGIETDIAALRVFEAGRRRVVLSALWLPAGLTLGFHARGSDHILAITDCAIADPAIVAALPVLRQLAARLASRRDELRLTVTRVDAGLDVAADNGKSGLDATERLDIAGLMAPTRILRVSLGGDPVVTRAAPELTIGPAKVVPPPGVFLQASAAAEAEMIALVTGAVGKAKMVADLFSGLGTFSLPLAKTSRVLAIDSEQRALGALAAAARGTQGLKPIETRARDLMREPLSRKELEPFDAVVFDPPRAGAEAQAAMLARSQVPTVVAVSCNPVTLARDLRLLIDGGYEIDSITPIDQFRYSAHLETVAVLRRPTRKRGR